MGVLRNLFGNSKDLEAVRLFNLGAAHAGGDRGLVRNDYEAARLYKLAADRGLAEAQYSLGTFYESSRGGLPQDDREAVHYYQLASYRRFAPAQYSLGCFYEQGRGGLTRDDHQAVRLYQRSAEQGIAAAQFALGRFFQEGRGGLPLDRSRAERLYELVAEQGFAPAKDVLLELRGEQAQQKGSDNSINTEEDPEAIFPICGSLPDVTGAQPSRAYHSPSYMAFLVRDVKSVSAKISETPGSIYPYAFVVVDPNRKGGAGPVHYVALEEGASGARCLGVFPQGGGHTNLGNPDGLWGDEQAFVDKAIELTQAAFGERLREVA